MIRALLPLLVLAACDGDKTPVSYTSTTSFTTPTADTTDTVTTAPSFGTVTIDIAPAVLALNTVVAHVSDADGAYVRTEDVTTTPAVLLDVPVGGFVTVDSTPLAYDGRTLSSIGDVQDGDVLHPVLNGFVQTGSVTVSVPDAPPVEFTTSTLLYPCNVVGGAAFPFAYTSGLFTGCFDPTASASGWAEVGDGGAVPVAVAFVADVAPVNGDLTLTYGGWITDIGRTQVSFESFESQEDVSILVLPSRGTLRAVAFPPSTVVAQGQVAQVEAATDSAFHDRVIVSLARGEGATSVWIASGAVAERGQTEILALTSSDIPPDATVTVDPAARTAQISFPEDWSCDGRGPNAAHHVWQALSLEGGFVSWELAAPFAADVVFPHVAPAVEAELAASTPLVLNADAASVPGGFDAIRTTPRVDGQWPVLAGEIGVGERVCDAVSVTDG